MPDIQANSSIEVPLAPLSSEASSQDFSKQTWWQEQLEKQRALAATLESWISEGDEEEQRETLECLMRALDEDRLSDRKLFPWLE